MFLKISSADHLRFEGTQVLICFIAGLHEQWEDSLVKFMRKSLVNCQHTTQCRTKVWNAPLKVSPFGEGHSLTDHRCLEPFQHAGAPAIHSHTHAHAQMKKNLHILTFSVIVSHKTIQTLCNPYPYLYMYIYITGHWLLHLSNEDLHALFRVKYCENQYQPF